MGIRNVYRVPRDHAEFTLPGSDDLRGSTAVETGLRAAFLTCVPASILSENAVSYPDGSVKMDLSCPCSLRPGEVRVFAADRLGGLYRKGFSWAEKSLEKWE